jgi:hypothetical protein
MLYFLKIILGASPSIAFDDKEKCDHEDKTTKVFVDADFSQPDDTDTDDDHSCL